MAAQQCLPLARQPDWRAGVDRILSFLGQDWGLNQDWGVEFLPAPTGAHERSKKVGILHKQITHRHSAHYVGAIAGSGTGRLWRGKRPGARAYPAVWG